MGGSNCEAMEALSFGIGTTEHLSVNVGNEPRASQNLFVVRVLKPSFVLIVVTTNVPAQSSVSIGSSTRAPSLSRSTDDAPAVPAGGKSEGDA